LALKRNNDGSDAVFGRTITDGRDRIPYRRALLEERTHNREQPVDIRTIQEEESILSAHSDLIPIDLANTSVGNGALQLMLQRKKRAQISCAVIKMHGHSMLGGWLACRFPTEQPGEETHAGLSGGQ
jgi:hypothetical protein